MGAQYQGKTGREKMVSLALKCRGREVEGPGAAGTASIYPSIVLSDFDCLT